MANNVTVDNYRLDAYKVKSTELLDKSQIQHFRLDIGSGTNEQTLTSADALPVTNSSYALRLDEAAPYTYVGEAAPGSLPSAAVWRIKRIDETSGLVITWADGNSNFDNLWDNRTTLSYS